LGFAPLPMPVQRRRGCGDFVSAPEKSGCAAATRVAGATTPNEAPRAQIAAGSPYFDSAWVPTAANANEAAACFTPAGRRAVASISTARDLQGPAPLGRAAFHRAMWCVGGVDARVHTEMRQVRAWEQRVEESEKAAIHPVKAAMHGGVSPHRNVCQALHMGWLLGIVSPAAAALLARMALAEGR